MVRADPRLIVFVTHDVLARDYVEGMWRMLQQPAPEDFVLATGETHPVREFVEKSFAVLDIPIRCMPPCPSSLYIIADRCG